MKKEYVKPAIKIVEMEQSLMCLGSCDDDYNHGHHGHHGGGTHHGHHGHNWNDDDCNNDLNNGFFNSNENPWD